MPSTLPIVKPTMVRYRVEPSTRRSSPRVVPWISAARMSVTRGQLSLLTQPYTTDTCHNTARKKSRVIPSARVLKSARSW